MLTQKRVKELFDYNEETGILIRKTGFYKAKKGDIFIKSYSSHGYAECSIDGESYLIHRIIWLWCNGYLPEGFVDHIDRNKLNNKLINLREASRVCNAQNSGNPKNNKSGVKGIYWCNTSSRWKAQIGINNRLKHIITSDNFDEAVCARLAVEQCIGWNNCDSNSPALNYVNNIMRN